MKRTLLIAGSVVILLAVLAAGAFTAVRLLAARNQPAGSGGVRVEEFVVDDGSGPVNVRVVTEPAAELPKRPAEAGGIFLREEDNSYFVGTGSISVEVQVENGETTVVADHSGPEVEVVVTQATTFYEDITDVEVDFSQSGEQRVQQVVQTIGRPDELQEGDNIIVWGERRGDRVVAEVIVFSREG